MWRGVRGCASPMGRSATGGRASCDQADAARIATGLAPQACATVSRGDGRRRCAACRERATAATMLSPHWPRHSEFDHRRCGTNRARSGVSRRHVWHLRSRTHAARRLASPEILLCSAEASLETSIRDHRGIIARWGGRSGELRGLTHADVSRERATAGSWHVRRAVVRPPQVTFRWRARGASPLPRRDSEQQRLRARESRIT
jgi:hypothetical protein